MRVWSLTPRRANPPPNDYFAEVQRQAAAKREAEGKRGDPSGVGDGPPAIEVVCERVLTGHLAAVTDVTVLPVAALLGTRRAKASSCASSLDHSRGAPRRPNCARTKP